MHTKLLVTGSSGFIGTNLMAAAQQRGYSVRGIDLAQPRMEAQKDVFTCVDILDSEGLQACISQFKPTSIIHLAARTDLSQRFGTAAYAANVEGVQNLVDAVQRCDSVESVIWASSRLVFAIDHRPMSTNDYYPSTQYGVSKIQGEQIIDGALHSLPATVIVRPTSIWGPEFGEPYRAFFESILKGRYVQPFRVRPKKTFGYVGNTVYQLLELSRIVSTRTPPPGGKNCDKYMLGDYEPLDLLEWANYISAASGRGPIRRVPLSVLQAIAKLGDILTAHNRHFPLTSFRLHNLVSDMHYDTAPLRDLIPNLPFTWHDGVDRTLAWLATSSRIAI